jgi:hypothetical protein
MKRRLLCGFASALAACALILHAGCTRQVVMTATTTRPLPPDPRPAPVTPPGAHVSEMAFAVGSKPDDTDGNSFPDRIDATIMLFAPPHPSPKFVDGTFEIVLYPYGTSSQADARVLAQWTIAGEALERAKHHSTVGPHYRLSLSMLDAGSDRYALALADLTCTLIPADGSANVTSDGVRSIQIGRAATANR